MKTNTPIAEAVASQTTGNFKKAYRRMIEFKNEAGIDAQLGVSESCSFDGHRWQILDDAVRLSIHDVGSYDDQTGQWEDNPDVMSSADGVAWLTFTPQQARQLARHLFRLAGKCRSRTEIDASDPELLKQLAVSEQHIRESWAQAEKEEADTAKEG